MGEHGSERPRGEAQPVRGLEGDIRVPGGPSIIVANASGAWVLTSRSRQVIRLAGQVGSRVRLAAPPAALAIAEGGAWVAMTPQPEDGVTSDTQT